MIQQQQDQEQQQQQQQQQQSGYKSRASTSCSRLKIINHAINNSLQSFIMWNYCAVDGESKKLFSRVGQQVIFGVPTSENNF
jgi:hypothetical protein